MKTTVIQPKGWPKPMGYANGIAANGFIFVAGQVGWNTTFKFPRGFAAQFEQALSNVMAVVKAGGGSSEGVVRMTCYVTDKHEYLRAVQDKSVGAAWKKHLGRVFPAMALVEVSGLVEDNAKVEIEATAVIDR